MTIKDADRALLKTIRENMRKLDECSLHAFVDDPTDARNIWKRKRCKHCGGTVDSLHAHWYKKGLDHGANIANRKEGLALANKQGETP